MGKTSKSGDEKIPMELRLTIAANLTHYISKADAPLNNEKALAIKAGVHPKTIQRLRRPQSSPSAGTGLGTLLSIANALDIDISLLLRRRTAAMYGTENPQQAEVKIPNTGVAEDNKRRKGRAE